MKEQVLEIQIARMGLQKKIDVVQGDSGRVLKCIVTDMQIPTGSTARIYAVKPSGAEIYNNCNVSGFAILVDLTTQMLAEVGVTYCQVQIMQSGKTVTSFEFSIDVKRNLVSSSAIESTNEFKALETAIWQAQQLYSPKFTEATSRVNIVSGETIPTLFGKIKKWFTDLGTSAFANIVNNGTTTVANTVLDGRMGKSLQDSIDTLNRNLNENIAINRPGERNIIFNALLIDATNPYAPVNINEQRVYSEGGTINMPPGCILGIREFYFFNTNWFTVKVTEQHPMLGRTWYNNYDIVKNAWSGWVAK